VTAPSGKKPPSELDIALPALDALSEELNRLAAVNAELVGQLRGAAATEADLALSDADSAELASLREENTGLRGRIAQLEADLSKAANDDAWAEQQREYESLLEEKSEVIRSLHLKLQEAQESVRRKPGQPVPREEELVQIKEELEQQRRQLEEDEQSLMNQMREMELAMSRDRAELARQRQEVQRLQAELNRDVEQANRDPELHERLNSLRRHQEPPKKDASERAAETGSKQSSGLLRRLFG
jgi:chromosome segregation ATPase